MVKLFHANGLLGFLDETTHNPKKFIILENRDARIIPNNNQLIHIDQNLVETLCSTISALIITYILHLDTTQEIYNMVER